MFSVCIIYHNSVRRRVETMGRWRENGIEKLQEQDSADSRRRRQDERKIREREDDLQ